MNRLLVALVAALLVLSGAAPAAVAQSSGMTTVPDGNVTTDAQAGSLPVAVSDLRGAVETSRHASTTEFTLTTPGRADAVAADAQVVGGGDVALVISDDVNHDGRQVAIPTSVVRQLYGGDLPGLIYGAHSSGDTWTRAATYENGKLVLSFDEFSSNTVTFAGTYSLKATPAVDGATFNYPVNDVDSASDPNVTFVGANQTQTEAELFSPDSTVTTSQTFDPAVAGDDVKAVTITYSRSEGRNLKASPQLDQLDGGETTTATYQSDIAQPANSVHIAADGQGSLDYEIFIDGTSVDSDRLYGDDCGCAGTPQETDYATSMPAGTNVTVTVDSGNSDKGVEAEISLDQPPQGDVTVSAAGDSATLSNGNAGDATITPAAFDTGDTIAVDRTATSGAATSLEIDYTEVTTTTNPRVDINGDTVSHTGTLLDGESVTLSGSAASIQSGENTIDVSVGDGTLSADAPTPAVKLYYSHDISDQQSVDYTGGVWTEQYAVERTYASAQSNASLTIPLDETATRLEYVEANSNGGAYSAVDPADYTFDDAADEITVQFGDVGAGETVGVRASASKLSTRAGAVEVVEPSLPNEAFEPKFKSTSDTTPELLVNATPNGAEMAYTSSESWGSDSEYAVATAAGENRLVVDGATTGETFRVSTIPVTVSPTEGDVRYHVATPSSTEPEFSVKPGPNGEDTAVDFNFTAAADNTEYELYSETRGVVVDSGTAESPLTLTDDDSEETLFFSAVGGGGESSGGGGGAVGPITVSASPTELPLTILALAGGVLALFVGSRAVGGDDATGGVTGFVGQLTAPVLGSWWGRIALAGVGLVGALRYSLIEIGTDAQVVLVAGLALVVTWLVLRRVGDVSLAGFATVAVPVVLLALEAVNPGSIAPSIGSGFERFTGLAIIAVAALAWRWLSARSGPDTRVVFSAGGDDQ